MSGPQRCFRHPLAPDNPWLPRRSSARKPGLVLLAGLNSPQHAAFWSHHGITVHHLCLDDKMWQDVTRCLPRCLPSGFHWSRRWNSFCHHPFEAKLVRLRSWTWSLCKANRNKRLNQTRNRYGRILEEHENRQHRTKSKTKQATTSCPWLIRDVRVIHVFSNCI